jgi:dihydroxyacetone kinase-like predicted kinase
MVSSEARAPPPRTQPTCATVGAVKTGEVTIASRDAAERASIHKGDWLGLLEGEAVAGGSSLTSRRAVVEGLLAEPRDLLTLLVGADQPALDSLLERVSAAHPELDVDVQQGGQPHYHLLLSAE